MEGINLFYGEKSLNGYIYYYYLPRLPFQFRKELSDKIFLYEGKITFSLSTQSIIIIQVIEDLQSKEFREEIQAFGDISFFHHNTLFNIQHNKTMKDCQLKCILLSDFLLAITQYDSHGRYFNVLTTHGLPQDVSKDALIALFIPKEIEKKTHYHEFKVIPTEKYKHDNKEYDIPLHMPKIPLNYAVFSTIEERDTLMNYLNQCESSKNISNSNRSISTSKKVKSKKRIFKTPEPYPEHSYCHFCKQKYKDYFSHLKSLLHLETIDNNKDLFSRITDTFSRIKLFWEKKDQETMKFIPVLSQKSNTSKEKKGQNRTKTSDFFDDKVAIDFTHQELQQTQYNTNISGNTEGIKIKKSSQKKSKRKYQQMLEGNTTLLGENKHYLRSRDPHIIIKVNKCMKKLSKK